MSLKDKLEIGLKPDAPYRPDNLPEMQKDDPACQEASEPGDSARLRRVRDDCDDAGRTRTRARVSARAGAKAKVRSQKSEVRRK